MTGLAERAAASAQVVVADLSALDLDDADAHHLGRVLRLRDAEAVIATDGQGSWRRCLWRASARSGSLVADGDVHRDPAPDPVEVWVPALHGARSDWSVQKLTELGVDRIGLLATDRSQVALGDGAGARLLERWRRVAREAACQSRRTRLPELAGPATLSEVAAQGVARCDLLGGTLPEGTTGLAVGPEGGFSDAERAVVPEAVSLGGTVLRTETAALAAAVVLVAARHVAPAAAP